MPAASTDCRTVPVALCLGGLDPSAGAGVLRDILTLSSFQVHPMGVSTAQTLQNGAGCLRISEPAADPAEQVEALRPHLKGLWGVKLGLCALDAGALQALVALLEELAPPVQIWDPILAPTAGVTLHKDSTLRRMAKTILRSGAWIVSPNRPEAAVIGGLDSGAEPSVLAAPLLELGARGVWLKGGHAQGECVEDFWVDAQGVQSLGVSPRLPGERRGTGCTLASAWLGYRLEGQGECPAARSAAAWLRRHWAGAVLPGGFGRPCFATGQA